MNAMLYVGLLDDVEKGRRFPTLDELNELPFDERLRLQRVMREKLFSMTPQQRLLRSQRGELGSYLNGVWFANFPGEVPLVEGHLPWHAATLCDIVDHGAG